jgi:hypothetical protein
LSSEAATWGFVFSQNCEAAKRSTGAAQHHTHGLAMSEIAIVDFLRT